MQEDTKYWIKKTKVILLIILAAYFFIVALGNLTDYQTNYQFVEHVLKMDTTFNSPNLMWRAINNVTAFHVFYWVIIITEIFAFLILTKGAILLSNKNKKISEKGKSSAIKGLLISMIIWFGYFITIGGEWFAMWQSSTWNGLSSAFRMFTISALTLLILMSKD